MHAMAIDWLAGVKEPVLAVAYMVCVCVGCLRVAFWAGGSLPIMSGDECSKAPLPLERGYSFHWKEDTVSHLK